jgi:signal transduction histidine kinase
MSSRRSLPHAVFGAHRSLQRNLTVNILLALLATIVMSMAVLIWEFMEHLEENLEVALAQEAQEVLFQVDPGAPHFGMDPQALRFRSAEGAYRYTVFGPDMQTVAGGEDSPQIRRQMAALSLGTASEIKVPGERYAMGLCGVTSGRRACVLASSYNGAAGTPMVDFIWHEIEEQVQWILIGTGIVLSAALVAARVSLRPLESIRNEAVTVGPETPGRRLSISDLPSEFIPLVSAVNKAFERLENGYQAQREFSSNVAHEVRTPLAVLHSSVDRIEDATLRRELKRDLRSLETIFEQLIDLARADALVPASFQDVALDTLAVRSSGERAQAAIRQGKSLAVTGAADVHVRGNAGLLAIALDNLVRNALSYSPKGTEVEIHVTDAPRGLIVLDRGPGIPTAERDVLFDRFRRGATTGSGQGSGIGLAIVKSVAEAHGATIRIEDNPGGGSAFVLEFADTGSTSEG